MKKIIHTITGFALLLSFGLASCTKDFTEINTDSNGIPSSLPQQLLQPALINTLTYNMIRNRNFNNELMQVTVDPGDGDGKVFRYDYRATFADYLYNGWYTELTNFKDLYKFASVVPNVNKSYMGISLVCQSWIYSMLTDTYGDVPYFKSTLARDSFIYEAPFDKQKDIYLDIFNKLDTANVLLSAGTAINAPSDPIYAGNISRWRKFCNSLYLRLLLRVSGKSEISEFVIGKIKDILVNKTSTYPIIANNDESAILRWTGVAPLTSPYVGIRESDFRTPGLASYFIDNLVAWNFPLLDIPLYTSLGGPAGFNRWGIAPYSGAYLGIPSGYSPGTDPLKKSYFYSNTSAVSMMTEPLTGMIMNYSEIKFIQAEAAVKGWITGSAATYYNDGVGNYIKLWLPTWAANPIDYINAADIDWDDNLSLDGKMEMIHKQKYYALFLEDLEQWFEYRRTGHPVLPKGAGLRNNGVMPARLTYPVYVQSTNPTNYKLAVAAQGPDVISTQVWWQKP